jgi:hypothetical protein
METPLDRWIARLAQILTALGERPLALFCLALALNALAFPYQGIVLDARLYSFQVLNRVEDGACSDDLFFRFGSQDQYSLFSLAVAPVARCFGLPLSFFLVYLLCNSLLILGMQRLTAALISRPGLSALALLFLATNPLVFGGWHVFQVNEPYLTSRNTATALTLLGLAEMMRGRHVMALLLLLGACSLHPLMGIGGLAVLTIWLATEYLPRRVLLAAAAVLGLGGAVVLFSPPLAARVFGQMDDDWLMHVRFSTAYNFPDEWSPSDWLQIAVPFTLMLAAAWRFRGEQRIARLSAAVLLVAAGGLLATTVASRYGYALLFQAQPYRAVWLLKVLYVPLGLSLAASLWSERSERSRLAAVGVFGSMCLTSFILEELILPLAFLPLFALYFRGLEPKPRSLSWLGDALTCSLALGLFGWGAYKFGLIAAFNEPLVRYHGGLYALGQMLNSLGPVFWSTVALWLVARRYRRDGFGLRTATLAVAIFVAVQAASFLVPFTAYYRAHYQRGFDDVQFVSHFLHRQQHGENGRRPTVYWSVGLVDILWLDLRVNSFYDFSQIQGILFSRNTAMEGSRRARLVREFELERLREERILLSDRWCELLEKIYGIKMEDADPTRDGLLQMCREPGLDYVVTPHNFDGLYAETNGRVYVYDCRQLRRRFFPSPRPHEDASP